MFENISIIGPGLLGGSIAMAIKKRKLAKQVHVWARSESSRQNCIKTQWCDCVHENLENSVKKSDLIIICVPVDTIIPLFLKILKVLKADAIVTDVGSVKASICDAAKKYSHNQPVHFIGSHPMAGSEKKGMEHAYAELVENAPCIVTPDANSNPLALEKLINFWEALGMKTTCMDAPSHDALVAKISHLPHLIASALAVSLEDLNPNQLKHAGGGLRDTTRVAGGSPEIWEPIVLDNSKEVLQSLEQFEVTLQKLKTSILTNNSEALHKILDQGKSVRKIIENAQ